ncbi:uncharacterized protein LOC133915692 [Phragmites australis]|uniref:uncharacterized protein LOC133915692 n=1 Tax=Phragmites australis TaxID=29695 RepID=UPI002D774380|nr:uncharacterized protein LOC133915692 [Phragmites australis]
MLPGKIARLKTAVGGSGGPHRHHGRRRGSAAERPVEPEDAMYGADGFLRLCKPRRSLSNNSTDWGTRSSRSICSKKAPTSSYLWSSQPVFTSLMEGTMDHKSSGVSRPEKRLFLSS